MTVKYTNENQKPSIKFYHELFPKEVTKRQSLHICVIVAISHAK